LSAIKSLALIGIAMICLSASIGDVVYQNSTGDDVMPITQYTYSLSSWEAKEMDGTAIEGLDACTGELNIFADFKYEGCICGNLTMKISATGSAYCLDSESRDWYTLNSDMSDKDIEKSGSVTLKTLDGSSKNCDIYYEDVLASSGEEVTFYHSSADKTIYRVEVNAFCMLNTVTREPVKYVMVDCTFDLCNTVGTHGIYHPSETGEKQTMAAVGTIISGEQEITYHYATGTAWTQYLGTVTDQDGKAVRWYAIGSSMATSDGSLKKVSSSLFGVDEAGDLYTDNDVGINYHSTQYDTYKQCWFVTTHMGVDGNVDYTTLYSYAINVYQDGTVVFDGSVSVLIATNITTMESTSIFLCSASHENTGSMLIP
jgi:hypothetical protein